MEVSGNDIEVMKAWLEVSKDFTQLAIGALVLPISFIRMILGVPNGKSIKPYLNNYLYGAWLFLFSSIGFGMLYQGVATCYIGSHLVDRESFMCEFDASTVFTWSTCTLVIGVVLFLLGTLKSNGENHE
jgi:hypothetical protein